MLRRLLHIAVSIALVLVAAFLLLCYIPLNWPFLNEQILSRLQGNGDVRLAYENAHLLAGRGRYRVSNLTYYAQGAESSKPLLTIRELDVIVRPLALLFGREAFIESIEVEGPSELDLVYDRQGIGLGPKAAFLRQALRQAQPNSGEVSSQLPFDRLKIRDAKVACVERQPAPGLGGDDILPGMASGRLRIHDLNVDARSKRGGIEADIAGTITAGGKNSEFEGEAQFPAPGKASLAVAFPSIEVSHLFADDPALAVLGQKLDLAISIARSRNGYELSGTVRADEARFSAPDQQIDIADQQFQLICEAKYTSHTATLSFAKLSANSTLLDASASGDVAVTAPNAFEAKLEASRMGEDYQKLLSRLLPKGYTITAHDAGVHVDAAASGDRAGLASVIGKLSFSSVTVTSRYLHQPIEQMTGEVNFEPRRLVLHGGKASIGKTRVSAEGTFEGDYLGDRRGDLKLNWQAKASTADLFAAISANGAPQPAEKPATGSVQSEGSLQQFISLRDFAQSGTPKINGSVVIANAGFSHPSLPAPVQALNGKLRIRNQVVEVDSLRGDMQGNDVRVQGRLSGDKVFWKDPTVTATVSTRFDLREVFNYMPPHLRDKVVPYKIEGEASTNLQIYTKLANWSNAMFTGRVETKNVSFDPGLEFMTGAFSEMNSTIYWDGNTLRLEKFFARLNGEPITGSGVLSASEIALNLQSKMDIRTMPETFPKMQKWFVMEGPASADVRFSVAETVAPADAPQPQTGFGGKLIPMLSLVADRLEQAMATRSYRLDGKIQFGDETGGARIRHNAMPPARKNERGDTIPQAELVDLKGTAILSGDTIRTEKSIRCKFADTPNCSFNGAITFRENNLPKMDFSVDVDGEVRLDPWMLAWGAGLERPPSPPPGNKKFDLNAHITADRVYYRGQRAGALQADIIFHLDQNAGTPRRTQFRNIRVQALNDAGQLSASGNLQTYPWDPKGQFPKWNCQADMQQMQLMPMLNCIFKNVQTLDANVTGRIELAAEGRDPGRIVGGGTADMQNVAIHQTAVIQRLGQTTGQSFRQLFRTASAAQFTIQNNAISTPQIDLQTNNMKLTMKGSYFFDKRIDAYMQLGLFESVVGKIPIFGELAGEIAKPFDSLAGQLLSFRVTGAATDPRIQPILVPLFQGATNIQVPQ